MPYTTTSDPHTKCVKPRCERPAGRGKMGMYCKKHRYAGNRDGGSDAELAIETGLLVAIPTFLLLGVAEFGTDWLVLQNPGPVTRTILLISPVFHGLLWLL